MLVALFFTLRSREWPAYFSCKIRDGQFEMVGTSDHERPSRLLADWIDVSVHESSFAHSNSNSNNTSCYSQCSDFENRLDDDSEANCASRKTAYLIVNPVGRSHRN